MSQIIIGLCGIIGAGKDTVGNILEQDYGFKRISFAQHLKDACAKIFDWDRDLIVGQTHESRDFRNQVDPWWAEKLNIKNFTPRYALQHIGTDILRNGFHQQIWGLSTFKHILDNPDTNFVITDTRFSSEIDMIKENAGILAMVKRGDDPKFLENARNKQYYKIKEHQSEWDWIGRENIINHVIHNNGTLDELKITVKDFMNGL